MDWMSAGSNVNEGPQTANETDLRALVNGEGVDSKSEMNKGIENEISALG